MIHWHICVCSIMSKNKGLALIRANGKRTPCAWLLERGRYIVMWSMVFVVFCFYGGSPAPTPSEMRTPPPFSHAVLEGKMIQYNVQCEECISLKSGETRVAFSITTARALTKQFWDQPPGFSFFNCLRHNDAKKCNLSRLITVKLKYSVS